LVQSTTFSIEDISEKVLSMMESKMSENFDKKLEALFDQKMEMRIDEKVSMMESKIKKERDEKIRLKCFDRKMKYSIPNDERILKNEAIDLKVEENKKVTKKHQKKKVVKVAITKVELPVLTMNTENIQTNMKDLQKTKLDTLYDNLTDLKTDTKEIHYGFECDACQMFPIYGKRFTCKECPDYDLCENCNDDNHNEHKKVEYKAQVEETLP